jgi:hypothetical protein
MLERRLWGVGVAGLVLWAACTGSNPDIVVVGACAPGAQLECACGAGVTGFQICSPSGASFGECLCPDSAPAAGGGAGGSSGAGGKGGVWGIVVGGTGGVAGSAGSDAAAGAGGVAGSGGVGGTGGSGGQGGTGGSGGTGGAGTGGAPADSGPDAAGAGGVAGPDASVDAGGSPGARDSAIDFDGPTTCDPANVTSITARTCDLIAQDCPAGQTCGPRIGNGGSCETACIFVGQGTKALGDACASHSECSPGLRCAGYPCSRPCCAGAQDYLCGPGGRCDMVISFCGGAAYMYECRFPAFCQPWAHACSGQAPVCQLQYDGFECVSTNASDGGAAADAPCASDADCGDAQMCITIGDASPSACRWLCKIDAAGAPDAGTVGGAPGDGGCPGGRTCAPLGDAAMPWLGFCAP